MPAIAPCSLSRFQVDGRQPVGVAHHPGPGGRVAELARGLRFDKGVPLGARISDFSDAHRSQYIGGLARDYEVEMRQEIVAIAPKPVGRCAAPKREREREIAPSRDRVDEEGDSIHGLSEFG